jgi:hypothetical protein
MSTVLAGAASLAGMLFGSRRATVTNVGRVGTAVRSFGRSRKEAGDVDRAEDTLEALVEKKSELAAEIEAAIGEVEARIDPASEVLEPVELGPRKTDVEVRRVVLAWIPTTG